MAIHKCPESLIERISKDNKAIQAFRDHSFRVMYLSSMLAKKVGVYDEDLRTAALLHDIGKMGIANEILLKPDRLSDIERTIVQSHSHIGNLIVRKELNNKRAALFIRDHHENWDGSGYPRGLKGEKISIQGRIIRVCDSYDTITYEKRSYQEEFMSPEDAVSELRRGAWKQYDGDLVESFISILEELALPALWYDEFDSKQITQIFL
ncbi:hypothetical protein GCM10008967_03650 [Bacillus carboniphilus]|uniref:HD-GYP domain-containing protein n=1 Tax=Bacillus carboniphilus TaxID=86663 RepID=A0ABN0VSN9_9BACI